MIYPIKMGAMLFWTHLTFGASTALAKDGGFFANHNVGVSYDIGTSYARIGYDAPMVDDRPKDCSTNIKDSETMRCENYLARNGGSGSPGIFIEAPFKRQGLLYFEPGLTFSTVSYKGDLATSSEGGGTIPADQPLQRASMELYGINWQGYLRFGVTPRYLPDVLVSVGGGLQTVRGRIRVFDEKYDRNIYQPNIFGKVDVVIIRAGTAALSGYYGIDQSIASEFGSKLVDDNPSDSDLTNFRLALISASSGVRLLLPF